MVFAYAKTDILLVRIELFKGFRLFVSVENLENLTVYVGTSLGHEGNVCGSFNGPAVERGRVYIKCDKPVVGKAITIVKHANDSLVLCEVMSVGREGK